MNKTIFLVVLALGVLGIFGVVAINSNPITGNAVATRTGEVQNVELTFENYEYKLNPSTLTAGVPVRMEADLSTVYGCMRDVVISSFGVREYVTESDNIIEFTPDKTGTFNIACSMNMGRGQFTVVDDSGNKDDYVETQSAPTQGATCGASGGGCGCGSR